MDTQVDVCRRQHCGSFKRAHIAGFASAIVVFAVLILAKLANHPLAQVTWDTVAVFPLAVYLVVFVVMLWNFARAMKRARILDLDEVDSQYFVSVRAAQSHNNLGHANFGQTAGCGSCSTANAAVLQRVE